MPDALALSGAGRGFVATQDFLSLFQELLFLPQEGVILLKEVLPPAKEAVRQAQKITRSIHLSAKSGQQWVTAASV
ncbi:MAG: hypothetical protein LBD44_03550, partial [Spirochaetaceae bacterium]|nr:hypothetical protein [Spirochaetaceae bacterium]